MKEEIEDDLEEDVLDLPEHLSDLPECPVIGGQPLPEDIDEYNV